MLTIGSLFTGYGGLDLAVEHAMDAHTAWTCDIDPTAARIVESRFADAPNLGDIVAVDWGRVPPVDIITGGSPCQDLSLAGARAGMTDGTRSNLWGAMRDAIGILRPSIVIWENVRGALSAKAVSGMESDPRLLGDADPRQPHLRAIGRVLGDLADLGYDASWCGLRAADVGAPHQRFRVFVVAAHPGCLRRVAGWIDTPGETSSGRPFGEPGGCRGVPVNLLPTPVTSPATGNGHARNLRTEVKLLSTPRASDGTKGGPNQRGSSGDLMLPSAVHRLLPTLSVADVTGGRERRRSGELLLNGIARYDRWGDYAEAISRWEDILGRAAPDPTEPGRNRQVLAPHFVEWMMGLPEGWVTDVPGLTRAQQLKALGNGVVPQQAIAAITHAAECLADPAMTSGAQDPAC